MTYPTLLCVLRRVCVCSITLLMAGALVAQVPTNASLNGKYWFRQLQVNADASGNFTQVSSMSGSMTFNGAGTFSYSASQNTGAGGNAPVSGNGTYTVKPTGFVTFTKPSEITLTMNGRVGASLLVASTTEGQSNEFDILVAIPAASSTSLGTLNGTYQVGTLEFPSASAALARSTASNVVADGVGHLGTVTVNGHGKNLGGGVTTQTVANAVYAVNSDGSGTATFPLASGLTNATQLVSGVKTIYVSADGNYFIGGASTAGGLDLLFGVRALPSANAATTASLAGLYFTTGLAYASGASPAMGSYAGSDNSAGAGTFLYHRRYHSASSTFDFTGAAPYAVNADGTGTTGLERLAIGAVNSVGTGGNVWFSASAGDTTSGVYDLNIAVATPGYSGTGVFVNPIGIVNAASLAPVGSPVSPGEYVSLFGVGLALSSGGATGFPIPTTLNAVQVKVTGTNGTVLAPLNYVSANQINLLVPYAMTGPTATFQVIVGATASNSVDVPLANTAPGIFSQDGSGANLGVILHANFTLVNGAAPAARGETVQMFMTGLGAVSPAAKDGAPGPTSPLAIVAAKFAVFIDGVNAPITFQGLAPGFAGLYQVNFTIPANATQAPNVPLAISTNEAFLDQVSIAIK